LAITLQQEGLQQSEQTYIFNPPPLWIVCRSKTTQSDTGRVHTRRSDTTIDSSHRPTRLSASILIFGEVQSYLPIQVRVCQISYEYRISRLQISTFNCGNEEPPRTH